MILASLLPADLFPWRSWLEIAPKTVVTNALLKRYTAEIGSTHADYWTALKGAGMDMREKMMSDHAHSTEAGYDVMEPLARRSPAPLRIAR